MKPGSTASETLAVRLPIYEMTSTKVTLDELMLCFQIQAARTSYLVCRDTALAEDIVQSAFCLDSYTTLSIMNKATVLGLSI